MINPFDPLISQYANSPIIRQLMQNWNDDLDPRPLFADFYTKVWNINTAEGYGLDMWGRRVGVGRVISVPNTSTTYFGFSEGGGYQPFGQAPFYSGAFASDKITLSDTDYRNLILAKAMSNISGCSIPVINRLIYNVFLAPGRPYAGKRAYAIDAGNMTLEYFFTFQLSALDIAILKNSGALQRPAGVKVILLAIDPEHCFGFAGTGLQPFGQGTFQATQEI